MKNKINIAEILKDCPKGTKLYSPLCGKCVFDRLNFGTIICKKQNTQEITFTSKGYYMLPVFDDCECMIFPSKNQRDWSKFQRPFKDGDILISGLNSCEGNPFIFKQLNSFGNAECYCAINCYGKLIFNSDNWTFIKGCRFATEEEKNRLFDTIKDNGYKWNADTKTLEKLVEPKFKDGDRVVKKGDISTPVSIVRVGDKYYYHYSNTEGTIGLLPISEQDDWELVPTKFDINTLKPFDKVLVRDNNEQFWTCDWFSFHDTKQVYPFACVGHYVSQCIPYEENQHLLGTTNDCDEFYKNWE